jgi:predicted ester cyclase
VWSKGPETGTYGSIGAHTFLYLERDRSICPRKKGENSIDRAKSLAGPVVDRFRDIYLLVDQQENKAVVRRFFEELLSIDNLAVADELLSPGFRFYFAGSPDPMNLERYKEFLVARRATFPDRRFAVEDMIAEGDKVSARFTMRGTHAPSAREVSMTGIDMIRLAEGKMVEDRVEVDQLGMMQQLGVIPSPEEQAQA